MNWKLSHYIVTSDGLNVERTGFGGRVIFSTRSGAILSVNHWVWELLEASRFSCLSAKTQQVLIDTKILVPEDEDELDTIIYDNMSAIDNNDVLYQVVQPSAWCQLNCNYCGQEHSKQWLSEEHAQAFLQRVGEYLNTGKYRHLKIGWFGAEPLTGLEVIRSLSPRAMALAQNFECSYSSRIVTNALMLTPALANELLHKHSVQEAEITLDGLAHHHDQQRFTKTDKGSFEQIFTNLKAVVATTDMRLVVRCNVSRANANGIAPLIEKLAQEGLEKSLSFYTSPVYAWGNNAHETALTYEEYAQLEMEWLALQARLGFEIGLIPPRKKIVCMSVQKHAQVLDAYGVTYNCTEVPYVPAYGQPNIYAIKLPMDGMKTPLIGNDSPAKKLSRFNEQILAGEQQQCAKCSMLPVCGGHCPKSWSEQIEPCPSTKSNMRDRLNLLFALNQSPEELYECSP